MGLDTSHDCFHGSYGTFKRFRTELAKAAGYGINETPRLGQSDYKLDWEAFAPENYQGEWDHDLGDPLLYLLVHSDCDGVIHPEQGRKLADRLEQLLPLVGEGDSGWWMRKKTQSFIDGLRAAAEAGEYVDFH